MIWKGFDGAGGSLIKVLPRSLPGWTEEKHKRVTIANFLAEIRPKNLPNTNLDWYGPNIYL